MKELTIEQKAKAYDKAIERAKRMFSEKELSYLFPELRESEDERIRKGLIKLLRNLFNNYSYFIKDPFYTECISWLEKQGEKSNPYSGISFEYNGHIWGMCARDNGVDILLDKQLFKHLEKQSEQKPTDKEFTFKSIPRLLNMIEPTDRAKSYCQKLIDSLIKEGYVIDAMIVGECLKQMNGEDVPMAIMDEQKPYGQRKECLDCQFNYAGECKGFCQMKRDEQKPIEWKQENREELTEFENAMMHIGGSFFGENAGLDPNDTAVIKEQAELLLELAPKTEWNEEDEDMIRYIGNAITCKESTKYLEEKGIDMIKAHRWLESFKPQLKQEWSEEDEKRVNRISDFIWKNRKGDTDEIYQQEQDANWLKSLRGKVQSKQAKLSKRERTIFKHGLLTGIEIGPIEYSEEDLEKEIKRFTMSKELYEADSAIKAVAEHFFKLGLKSQNKDNE